MKQVDTFLVFWCVMVVIITGANFAWAINDLNRGSARFGWGWGKSERIRREEEPFDFWVAVGSKLLALPLGIFMIWFALTSFNR